MKYKKIIILAILLISLLAISAVSAEDNSTFDVINGKHNTKEKVYMILFYFQMTMIL